MRNSTIILSAFFIAYLSTSCSTDTEPATKTIETSTYDLALQDKLDVFSILPNAAENPENISSPAKINLGQKLYFDTRLSLEGNNSCNSCHNLTTYGVDNKPTSTGDDGGNGDRNSPTVLNSALHTSQFWDGRAKDVEEQAGMPILNPVEMAIPHEDFLISRLSDIEEYKTLFAEAFPEENTAISYENLRKAIAVFERQLLTPSRFDDYLKGNKQAMSEQEKQGLLAFVGNGCTACHSGSLLGGNLLQKFGIYQDYWEATNSVKIDSGKYVSTGKESDIFIFKSPSLRNVEKTGPYFHDGSVSDLGEAIDIMAKVQLNKELTPIEIENIKAFLTTLTGEVPIAYQTAPK